MTKTIHRAPPLAARAELAERGAESMRLGRFKDAIEAFKQLARQEPRPEWRQRLADAYAARARALADKGMFKEAAIVLENTLTPEGMVREPVLYLHCLIRQGQHQKAARIAQQCRSAAAKTPEAARLAELAAALSLAVPAEIAKPSDTGWTELAQATHAALAAWAQNKPPEQVEALLTRIPLRSPFGPLRLVLKSLIAPPDAAEKALGLLSMVPANSAFAGFRAAAKAALANDAAALQEQWSGFRRAQRKFVADVRGLPAPMTELLQQIIDAERRGPTALLALLLRPGLPLPADTLRSACLDLLPASPSSIQQFERRFGTLSAFDRSRALALAGEASGRWSQVQVDWERALASLSDRPAPDARLAQAVVLRHLADLAQRHPEITPRRGDDAAAEYLERSLDADPDHLTATLSLIEQHRSTNNTSAWHGLAERATRRFPDNTAVLMLAVDAAVERDAYKKAVGFARRLLALDPINQPVRQRMIELQLAYARKQMRAGRADLAEKALGQAEEWERADAPSASLRIGHALVTYRDEDPAAERRLRSRATCRRRNGRLVPRGPGSRADGLDRPAPPVPPAPRAGQRADNGARPSGNPVAGRRARTKRNPREQEGGDIGPVADRSMAAARRRPALGPRRVPDPGRVLPPPGCVRRPAHLCRGGATARAGRPRRPFLSDRGADEGRARSPERCPGVGAVRPDAPGPDRSGFPYGQPHAALPRRAELDRRR